VLHLPLLVFALAAGAAGVVVFWHGVVRDSEDSTVWNGLFASLPLLVVGLGVVVFVLSDARRAARTHRRSPRRS
jgi:hypothetical protein